MQTQIYMILFPLEFNITFPFRVCDIHYIYRNSWETRNVAERKLLQEEPRRPVPSFRIGLPLPPAPPRPSPSPSPSPSAPTPTPTPAPAPTPMLSTAPVPDVTQSLSPPSTNNSSLIAPSSRSTKRGGPSRGLILGVSIGGSLLLLLLIIGFFIFQYGKVTTVKPWATGLSGQLQRAFVTGIFTSCLYTENFYESQISFICCNLCMLYKLNKVVII